MSVRLLPAVAMGAVLLLTTALRSACGETGATPSALREQVLAADTADKAAAAYRAYFLRLGRAGLKERMNDEDTGVALQAAWEVHRKPGTRKKSDGYRTDDVYEPAELVKFVAFLKERTNAPVPDWWAQRITDVDLFPGRHHAFNGPRDPDPKKPPAAEANDSPKVEAKGDDLVYTAGGRAVQFPKATFDTLLPADYVAALGERRSVVAAYDSGFGGAYRVAGFVGRGGRPAWIADVWGAGRKVLGGLTFHRVVATEKGDVVYLFGMESHGAYVEAFDAITGKCQFRFCTGYWFNFSEAWVLK